MMFIGQLEQLFSQILAFCFHVIEESRCSNLPDYIDTDSSHQWIATVGATLVTRLKNGYGVCAKQGSQRYATADSFAEGHDVWFDTRQLIREQLARATATTLHFVHDQQNVVCFR